MEIGWTDVGRGGGYILVSCAHSNTSSSFMALWFNLFSEKNSHNDLQDASET
jgi:hypothetical protein